MEFIKNFVIIVVFGIFWFFLLFKLGKRFTPKSVIEIICFMRLFMMIGYVFVIGSIMIAYTVGCDMGPVNSVLKLLLLNFIVIPIFLIFCYLFGSAQFNTILNSSLYRYYNENKIIEEKGLREEICRLVNRWIFFHNFLCFWRKISINEILKRVCSSDY